MSIESMPDNQNSARGLKRYGPIFDGHRVGMAETDDGRWRHESDVDALLASPPPALPDPRVKHLEDLVRYVLGGKKPTPGWRDTARAVLKIKDGMKS